MVPASGHRRLQNVLKFLIQFPALLRAIDLSGVLLDEFQAYEYTIDGLPSSSRDTFGAQFTVQDRLIGDQASCRFGEVTGQPRNGPPVPLNVHQPCDPSTFQFELTSWNSSCNFQLNVLHRLDKLGVVTGQLPDS